MAAQRAANTVEEVLRKTLNQITDAELAEDATPQDQQLFTLMREVIKAKLRAPVEQQAAAMGMPADQFAGTPLAQGPAGGGMPSGVPMGGAPSSMQPVSPAPVPGVQSGMDRTAINPDEMRRMMAGPG